MSRTQLCLTFVLLLPHCAYSYKTIILISTPRSLSTVFLRMMAARGDFNIFNEPGIETFHELKNKDTTCDAARHETVPSFHEIQERLLNAQQEGNVFVKEMFYAAQAYLLTDMFIRSPDCHVIFIVRNPHHASISLFKKLSLMVAGDQQKLWQLKSDLPDYLSYASLYSCYQHVQRNGANPPYVIIAQELAANPRTVVAELCYAVGIPMLEHSLSWQALDQSFEDKDIWNDGRTPSGAHLWYDRAMCSTGFAALPDYKVDHNGNPTFEEITDPELRGAHRWEYYYNRMYYNTFVNIATKHQLR